MVSIDLIVKNARQIISPPPDHSGRIEWSVGPGNSIGCANGKIVYVGLFDAIAEQFAVSSRATIINAENAVVAPGFVDPHTHPVFFGTRENEFELRIRGKTYQDIAQAGGGIRYSVRQVRQASKQQLIDHALPFLDRFIEHGTTTIEAKSGYGLSLDDEIKSLQVIRELNRLHPLELVPTFLGAHEIPDEYRDKRQEYIDLIIHEMIPRVAEEGLAEFCDIFCEDHVFNRHETEKILTAASDAGLKLKIHADQLGSSGGSEIAARLRAVSADHLDYISDAAIEAFRQAGTVPVLLPGAVFFLGLGRYAPARKMIDAGLPAAIATDFNPGSCMTQSMPMMMTLACIYMKMLPEEVWLAATAHAARAIHRSGHIGTLAPGSQADIVLWNIPNYKYLPYHFGINHAGCVIKKGNVVWKKSEDQVLRGHV
ncbi:MAG: imidazolonepropionase [Candidatus Zhuqueibacterota bacterium]